MLSAATDSLALNPQGLDALRLQAKNGSKESVHAAAAQFESYFMQMMLRTMRQTLSQDGPFDSQETKTFSDMFDQQIAQSIAKGKGIGLADMLAKQMELSMQTNPGIQLQPRPYDFPAVTSTVTSVTKPSAAAPGDATDAPLNQRNFVNKLWPHAVDAASELGVSPHVLLAQAALETGWGKHELKGSEGNSYNLFNIKVGKNWTGAKVGADTTEYVNGKPVQQSANFKAYGSYGEAFSDYARQIKTNPRYAQALSQGGDAEAFARGLQSGGYATDPAYADKILRVINSPAFRESLASSTALLSAD
jgi:flagellar protein FlgJ